MPRAASSFRRPPLYRSPAWCQATSGSKRCQAVSLLAAQPQRSRGGPVPPAVPRGGTPAAPGPRGGRGHRRRTLCRGTTQSSPARSARRPPLHRRRCPAAPAPGPGGPSKPQSGEGANQQDLAIAGNVRRLMAGIPVRPPLLRPPSRPALSPPSPGRGGGKPSSGGNGASGPGGRGSQGSRPVRDAVSRRRTPRSPRPPLGGFRPGGRHHQNSVAPRRDAQARAQVAGERRRQYRSVGLQHPPRTSRTWPNCSVPHVGGEQLRPHKLGLQHRWIRFTRRRTAGHRREPLPCTPVDHLGVEPAVPDLFDRTPGRRTARRVQAVGVAPVVGADKPGIRTGMPAPASVSSSAARSSAHGAPSPSASVKKASSEPSASASASR